MTSQVFSTRHLSVLPVGVEEDGSVVLADLLALADVLDGLHGHHVLHVEAHDRRVARVVEHGQRRVDAWTQA